MRNRKEIEAAGYLYISKREYQGLIRHLRSIGDIERMQDAQLLLLFFYKK